jgi:hypothetical protein
MKTTMKLATLTLAAVLLTSTAGFAGDTLLNHPVLIDTTDTGDGGDKGNTGGDNPRGEPETTKGDNSGEGEGRTGGWHVEHGEPDVPPSTEPEGPRLGGPDHPPAEEPGDSGGDNNEPGNGDIPPGDVTPVYAMACEVFGQGGFPGDYTQVEFTNTGEFDIPPGTIASIHMPDGSIYDFVLGGPIVPGGSWSLVDYFQDGIPADWVCEFDLIIAA